MTRLGYLALAIALVLAGAARGVGQETEESWESLDARARKALESWQLAAAEEILSVAIARARALPAPDLRLAKSLALLATVREFAQQLEPAEKLAGEALDIAIAVGPDGLAERDDLLQRMAHFCRRRGDFAGAVGYVERLLVLRDQEKADPDAMLAVLLPLGGDYRTLGRYPEAQRVHERVIKIIETTKGEFDPDLSQPLLDLARVLRIQKKLADAEPLFERWIVICKKARGEDTMIVAAALDQLAEIQVERGHYERALATLGRWIEVLASRTGHDNPNVQAIRRRIAAVEGARGNHEKALGIYAEVLAVYERALGLRSHGLVPVLSGMGRELIALGRFEEAIPKLERGIELALTKFDAQSSDVVEARLELARALAGAGEHDRAIAEYRAVIGLRETAAGSEHPSLMALLEGLAACLEALEQNEEAAKTRARAATIRARWEEIKAASAAPGMK